MNKTILKSIGGIDCTLFSDLSEGEKRSLNSQLKEGGKFTIDTQGFGAGIVVVEGIDLSYVNKIINHNDLEVAPQGEKHRPFSFYRDTLILDCKNKEHTSFYMVWDEPFDLCDHKKRASLRSFLALWFGSNLEYTLSETLSIPGGVWVETQRHPNPYKALFDALTGA